MEFQDELIICSDCQQEFTFSAGEQEFYKQKGLNNPPKRCPVCRKAKKQRSRDHRAGSGGGRGRW